MRNFFKWLWSLFHSTAPVVKQVAKVHPKKTITAGTIAAVIAIATPFVGSNEGLRLTPYYDSVGVLTVCYGETQGVHLGQKFTKPQCSDKLKARLIEFWHGMHDARPDGKYIQVDVSDKTDAALLSFAYNIGLAGFRRSHTLEFLNKGKYERACNAMMGWVKPASLKSRRQREVKFCLEGL